MYYDEIQPETDNCYILTIRNGDIAGGFPNASARIALYDMEYRREQEAPIPGVSDYWHLDAWQAQMLGYQYVPVGGHAGLRLTDTDVEKQYDVAYLAYMTHRRQHIYNALRARGVSLTKTSAWGMERDALLNASRVYLHIHQSEEFPAVPGLRLVVAAAYKLPVVMESPRDAGYFATGLYDDSYAGLVGMVCELKQRGYDAAMQFMGETLHQNLCHNLTFRASVERAL